MVTVPRNYITIKDLELVENKPVIIKVKSKSPDFMISRSMFKEIIKNLYNHYRLACASNTLHEYSGSSMPEENPILMDIPENSKLYDNKLDYLWNRVVITKILCVGIKYVLPMFDSSDASTQGVILSVRGLLLSDCLDVRLDLIFSNSYENIFLCDGALLRKFNHVTPTFINQLFRSSLCWVKEDTLCVE